MIIESRQINALADLIEQAEGIKNNDIPTPEEMAIYMQLKGVRVLPCMIGDRVWAKRNYKGTATATAGVVSEMFYTNKMELVIVVKSVARGKWGERVFATQAECERAIHGGKQ